MKTNDPIFQQLILDLINGALNLRNYNVPESEFVKSEFYCGSPCSLAYAEVLDAYSRICSRLQSEDLNDPDVELIINNLLAIGNHIALKMFQYGAFFAQQSM